MKVISPITISDSNFIDSSVPEDDAVAWDAATNYALADSVMADHVVYVCIQSPNTAHPPATSPLYWSVSGPTNRWAMLDSEISTATTATDEIELTVKAVNPGGLALINVTGNSVRAVVRSSLDGDVVYDQTTPLDGTLIADWYQYFFEPFALATEAVFLDLPPYPDAHITITIAGDGQVSCGHVSIGTVYEIGKAQAGAGLGIIDYSRKDVSTAGVVTLQRRKFSKRFNAPVIVPTAQVARVNRTLADLRATPCVWIAGADSDDRIIIFGFYRDYGIDIAYPTHSICSLEIEGLT